MIVLDTSGLLAWIDDRQRAHSRVAEVMTTVTPPYWLSPFVLAELDYLLATRVSSRAQNQLLEEVERGVYHLESFTSQDVGRARELMAKHEDLGVGLADASIAVLVHRRGTRDVLTLDEQHFRVLMALDGSPFRLFPADA